MPRLLMLLCLLALTITPSHAQSEETETSPIIESCIGERISIINFEDNTHYIVAYHQGSVFDWRVPPEDD